MTAKCIVAEVRTARSSAAGSTGQIAAGSVPRANATKKSAANRSRSGLRMARARAANVLGTAVEYNLPVVWVVWNNYAYASIRGLQRGYLDGRELATDFHHPETGKPYNPDFAAMARSAGVEGVRVDRAGDIGNAIKMAIAANKPYVIDVNINADQNPGGAGVWELPGLGVSKVAIGGRYQPG